MTADISTFITLPAPVPQTPAPQAVNSGQDTSQTQSTQGNVQSQQNSTRGSDNTTSADQSDSHFSQVLNAHNHPDASTQPGNTNGGTKVSAQTAQNSNSRQQGASTSGANDNSASAATPPSSSSPASSGSGASSASGSSAAVVALLLAQIQTSAGDHSTSSASGAASSASGSSSLSGSSSASGASSASDTLAQLQQLLQELIQLSQKNGTASASSGSGASTSSGSGSATPKSKTPAKDDTDSLTQIVAQIAALLQQQPAAQASTSSAGGSSQNAAVAGDGSTGGQQAAELTQLIRELAQKLGAQGTGANAASVDAKAASSGPGASAASASFSTQLDALLTSGDGKEALQSALAKVSELLASTPGGKQDSSTSDNSGNGNNAANANVTGQVVPASTQSAQQTQDSGFAKLVSAPAASAPPADQVLVQIKNAVADGSNQIRIQLSPEDLGKVVVQLTTNSEGKTGITITADNRNTLAMLQNEAKALTASLRDIGLKTDTGGLSFNLSGQQQQQQQQGKQGGYTQVAGVDDDNDADYNAAVTKVYSLRAQEGLDIRV